MIPLSSERVRPAEDRDRSTSHSGPVNNKLLLLTNLLLTQKKKLKRILCRLFRCTSISILRIVPGFFFVQKLSPVRSFRKFFGLSTVFTFCTYASGRGSASLTLIFLHSLFGF